MTTIFLKNCWSEGKNHQNSLRSKDYIPEAENISVQSDKEMQ